MTATVFTTATPPSSHIHLDDRGVAWIDDTNVKVIEVAAEYLAHGDSPEEMCAQHWGTLSLGQIYAALSYYFDHQAAFDAELDRQLSDYRQRRIQSLDSPGRQRLRAMGLLP